MLFAFFFACAPQPAPGHYATTSAEIFADSCSVRAEGAPSAAGFQLDGWDLPAFTIQPDGAVDIFSCTLGESGSVDDSTTEAADDNVFNCEAIESSETGDVEVGAYTLITAHVLSGRFGSDETNPGSSNFILDEYVNTSCTDSADGAACAELQTTRALAYPCQLSVQAFATLDEDK